MGFYLKNEGIRKIALNTKNVNYDTGLTPEDAFFLLLNGVDYETIHILCEEVAKEYPFSPFEIYGFIQNMIDDRSFKKLVLDKAYELILAHRKFGNKRSGIHCSCNWIIHSLFEAKVAAELAKAMGLNPDIAMKNGILHDEGRKFDQSGQHIIKGFEDLVEKGYKEEAFCSLSHSFLSSLVDGVYKGNVGAICDQAAEGFYINEKGQGVFKEGSELDDVCLFLENYEYNIYDKILNIADLMATSDEVVSPYDRMMDVYSRRKKGNDINKPFFKVCFINSLNEMLYMITGNEQYHYILNVNDLDPVEIDRILKEVSDTFWETYNSVICKENIRSI